MPEARLPFAVHMEMPNGASGDTQIVYAANEVAAREASEKVLLKPGWVIRSVKPTKVEPV